MKYHDEKGAVRTVPVSCTYQGVPQDTFLEQSAGRSIVHIKDLAELRQLLRSLQCKIGEREGGHGSKDELRELCL